jgi:hypothetical protein
LKEEKNNKRKIIMPYNFVAEDDNKFTLNNGDQEFSIAKYDLDDGFMEKLRMLPRAYAEGGRVGYADGGVVAPELISQDEESFNVAAPGGGVLTAPKDFSDPATMQLYNMAAAQAERSSMAAPSDMPRALTDIIPRSSVPQPVSPMAPAVTDRPIGQPIGTPDAGAQEQPAYLKMMQDMMAGGQPASFAMPADIQAGYEKMQAGIRAQAKAHAEAAMEQSRLYEEQAKDLAVMELARKKNLEALDNETKRLQADVATNKIDPSRIYNNMTTGNRVMAGISLLLGGISQGLSKAKSNPAMDVINNAIDRDIDAQKAELGKKQNLLAINLQKYGRLDAAFQATKMQMMAVTQAQINQQAAKMGSKQALAAAEVASGQMDIQQAMLKNQLAAAFAKDQMMNKPEGLSFNDLMKLDEDTRDRLVPMAPTAGPQFKERYIPAVTKDDATKIKTAYTLYQQTLPLLKRVQSAIDKGFTLPKSAQNDIAKGLESELILLQKNIQQLGQITGADMDLVMPLVPKVGTLFDKGERAKLDMLFKRNDELIDAAYAGKTGYNRAAFQGAQTSAFGRK